jgi:hypothetical protein
VPLGDNDPKGCELNKLCTHVVHLHDPARSYTRKSSQPLPPHAGASAENRIVTDYLPRCLDLVTVDDVIRAIELYFQGGVVRYLDAPQADAAKAAIEGHHTIPDA